MFTTDQALQNKPVITILRFRGSIISKLRKINKDNQEPTVKETWFKKSANKSSLS
jgi:hypothetical protein